MHLVFESITLKRFRSFTEEATLHFNGAGNGLYFLKGKNHVQKALGSNGSGKSSILDALMWCLYGKTVQGLKNPDITPWSGKGSTSVEVFLSIDGKKSSIKRTIAPNLLTIDGKESGQGYVDSLISIPMEVIPYTIIMGQRQPLFFDLTASEKLKIFAEPLNLERWDARSTHASELVRNLEIEIAASEREQELFNQQLIEVQQDTESAKDKKDLWESLRSEALTGKDKERKTFEKKIAAVMVERDTADLKLDRAETEIRGINISKHVAAEGSAANALGRFDSTITAATKKEKELKEMISSVKEESCPTCQQPIKSRKTRDELVLELDRQIAALGIKELISERAIASTAHDKTMEILDLQSKAKNKFEKEAEEARDVLDRLLPQIAEWEAAIKAIDILKAEYENQNNPYSEQLTTLRKRKTTIEQQIENSTAKATTKKEYCERVRPWMKWFKDIKLYTLEEILQELEITTNGLMEEFGLTGWNVYYDIERETKAKTVATGLHIEILSPSNSRAVKWGSWSGGEAQRLRIIGSIALASVLLNHLGISTNLAVFDEPTESLSKEGVVDLVDLLANYAKESKKNIWLIDHHTIESSQFVDVITVTKDKQGSFLNVS